MVKRSAGSLIQGVENERFEAKRELLDRPTSRLSLPVVAGNEKPRARRDPPEWEMSRVFE